MASINKKVASALQKEFLEGTVFRVDMDRVDVAPDGSPGILRSLPLTGDRDKVQPGDRVRVINVSGERVALAGDMALEESVEEVVEDAGEIALEERLYTRGGEGRAPHAHGLRDLEDVDIASVTPMDQDVLTWDTGAEKWVPKGGGGGGSIATLSDVVMEPAPTGGEALCYDGQSKVWTPSYPSTAGYAENANIANYATDATNADTVDGQHANSFLGRFSISGRTIAAGGGSIGPDVQNQGGGAAGIALHRVNNYAVNLGLDTDNQLKVGGWSMGNAAHRIFHAGNNPTGFSVSFDGGGSVVQVGAVAYVRFPCDFRAQQLHMFCDVQATISVQIHKGNYDNWPTVSYLTTTTISNAYKYAAGLGTAWDAVAGDVWRFTVSANNNAKVASINMWGYKL